MGGRGFQMLEALGALEEYYALRLPMHLIFWGNNSQVIGLLRRQQLQRQSWQRQHQPAAAVSQQEQQPAGTPAVAPPGLERRYASRVALSACFNACLLVVAALAAVAADATSVL